MFIETSDFNILFDTGKSENFIDNAQKLKVDLYKTDAIVLSHSQVILSLQSWKISIFLKITLLKITIEKSTV